MVGGSRDLFQGVVSAVLNTHQDRKKVIICINQGLDVEMYEEGMDVHSKSIKRWLLDSENSAKIVQFGLSEKFPHRKSHLEYFTSKKNTQINWLQDLRA